MEEKSNRFNWVSKLPFVSSSKKKKQEEGPRTIILRTKLESFCEYLELFGVMAIFTSGLWAIYILVITLAGRATAYDWLLPFSMFVGGLTMLWVAMALESRNKLLKRSGVSSRLSNVIAQAHEGDLSYQDFSALYQVGQELMNNLLYRKVYRPSIRSDSWAKANSAVVQNRDLAEQFFELLLELNQQNVSERNPSEGYESRSPSPETS